MIDIPTRTCFQNVVIAFYLAILIVVLPFLIGPLVKNEVHPNNEAFLIAGIFIILSLPISAYSIVNHLVNFTQPDLQRPICRILAMVPVYALDSFLSIRFTSYAIYFDTIREWYEAYAIYNFMSLVLRFLQRNYDVSYIMEYKPYQRHLFPFCCLPILHTSDYAEGGNVFIRFCKTGVLQYCVTRTITTMLAFITHLFGCYGSGLFNWRYAYPYLVFINNISQIWAMYCLILFYYVMRVELRPLEPLAKFVAIKLVVFMTFWQSVLIAALVAFGAIKPKDEWEWNTKEHLRIGLDNFMIVIEMFVLALVHHLAFPVSPYSDGVGEMGVSWHSNIPALWDHSDVRSDIAEHVRVIGSAVQGGATRARSRIVDILSNQVWTRDSQRIEPASINTEYEEDEELLSPLI